MKKLLFLMVFIAGTAVSADAQSCCAKKAGSASTCSKSTAATCSATTMLEADKAATAAGMEKKVCEDGSICYMKKSKDAKGVASNVSMMYDATAKKFVDCTMSKDGKSCAKGAKSCSHEKTSGTN
jgi:hypothetical protein